LSLELEQTEEGLLTVDALHQFAYCPRRAFLMHVEGLMAHNAYTEDGRRVHRRVDRVDHVLEAPAGEELPDDGGDDPPNIARSVALSDPGLGLTGKLDLVSSAGDEAVPVETKRGRAPDNPQRSWEPERVQVMAQGLLLRAHGWRSSHGFLYFAGSRRRVEIAFTPELEARTLDLLRQAKAQRQQSNIPEPLRDSPKCHGCSVAGLCLPDETLALREAPPDPVAPSIRRLYPPRDEASPLYVQMQGSRVGTRKGTIIVEKQGEMLAEVRLKDTDHLVICGNVQVGTQAIHLLCEAGIPLCYLSTGHWFYGFTHGFALRNAYDRAAQFRAADDGERCLAFARTVVASKIVNQRTLLLRNASPRPQVAVNALADLQPAVQGCTDAATLLGLEGTAARHYFQAFTAMVKPADVAARFDAAGRARRPPPDPLNACLSFGYALLAKECTVALAAVGLDPFWGFYHRPRHGRPSLALDLMEEFRPLVTDSAVLSAFNTGMLTLKDFTIGASGCLLKDSGRKAFIRAFEARMDQLVTHPALGYRASWRVMIRLQARLLGRWLRGDIPHYVGMTTR
jgi:CRISPR-associated protein Cas1